MRHASTQNVRKLARNAELWGNGGKVLADHSRSQLGDGITGSDSKHLASMKASNDVFVKALLRELSGIARRAR